MDAEGVAQGGHREELLLAHGLVGQLPQDAEVAKPEGERLVELAGLGEAVHLGHHVGVEEGDRLQVPEGDRLLLALDRDVDRVVLGAELGVDLLLAVGHGEGQLRLVVEDRLGDGVVLLRPGRHLLPLVHARPDGGEVEPLPDLDRRLGDIEDRGEERLPGLVLLLDPLPGVVEAIEELGGLGWSLGEGRGRGQRRGEQGARHGEGGEDSAMAHADTERGEEETSGAM